MKSPRISFRNGLGRPEIFMRQRVSLALVMPTYMTRRSSSHSFLSPGLPQSPSRIITWGNSIPLDEWMVLRKNALPQHLFPALFRHEFIELIDGVAHRQDAVRGVVTMVFEKQVDQLPPGFGSPWGRISFSASINSEARRFSFSFRPSHSKTVWISLTRWNKNPFSNGVRMG